MSRLAILFLAAIIVSTQFVSAAGLNGQAVRKGTLVVRYGAADTKADYQNEEGYTDGAGTNELQDVSALCADEVNRTRRQLVASDREEGSPRFSMVANSTTLISAGATIIWNPLPNSPNHCLILNVPLRAMTSAFH